MRDRVIEEHARIVQVQGEYAWVEIHRSSGCSTCPSSQGCGAASLASLWGRKPSALKVFNPIGARPGDDVIIGIAEGALVNGSLLLYLVPLLFMLGFAFFGETLGRRLDFAEGLSILLGLVGMLIGFAGVRRIIFRLGRDGRFQPVILRLRYQVVPSR
jgi:sigma-E factor negative regulatory protein RseC